MSFSKAEQLLDLAVFISASQQGITLDQVVERYGVHLRTAQRMMRALENRFPDVHTAPDGEGRKRWTMLRADSLSLVATSADELAACVLGIEHLRRAHLDIEARHLESLRDKIMATLPRQRVNRLAPDFEALLEAQGFVARPGPKARLAPAIAATIAEAIKACRPLEIAYTSHLEDAPQTRIVWPLGLLTGTRRYLAAVDPQSRRPGTVKTYRLESIAAATLGDGYFVRPPRFDLQAFANQAFGLFQRADETGDIVWRFAPSAAEHAAGLLFHPLQTEEWQADGALIVRFRASGFLEMAWYLYQWGDAVEVLSPAPLRALVAGYERTDFPAFP
jgi:predicted DNA-binding transcriptional regulator YafY